MPNRITAATFCVGCALENEPDTAGPLYAAVDWPACAMARVACPPGNEMNSDLTGCIPCATMGATMYSSIGVRCELCPPGTEPNWDRSECNPCPAGQYSPAGICNPCTDWGDNYYSDLGATRCESCLVGTEPVPTRSQCVQCVDGWFSPYGVCMQCTPGKQNDANNGLCEDCADLGVSRYSPDGTHCGSCVDGTQPNQERTACEPCLAGYLGVGGGCVEVCEALGCQNFTLSTSTYSAVLDDFDAVCPGAFSWTMTGQGKTVDESTGSCGLSGCLIVSPVGINPLLIVADSALGIPYTATCTLRLTVRTARVALFGNALGDALGQGPNIVGVESLSTTYQDETLQIQNEGDDPVMIYSMGLDQTWLSPTGIRDDDGVGVELPAMVGGAISYIFISY